MKQLFILFMALFMFFLSTAVLVLIPQAVSGPLESDQIVMVAVMVLTGYICSGVYFYVYITNRKTP